MDDCTECVHNPVCELWISQEMQDAGSFQLYGCDYFKVDKWISVKDGMPETIPCAAGKPQTNADRIRDMDDETLCERLYHVWRNEVEKGNDIAVNWCHSKHCQSEECDPDKHKACILRWLRQPADQEGVTDEQL